MGAKTEVLDKRKNGEASVNELGSITSFSVDSKSLAEEARKATAKIKEVRDWAKSNIPSVANALLVDYELSRIQDIELHKDLSEKLREAKNIISEAESKREINPGAISYLFIGAILHIINNDDGTNIKRTFSFAVWKGCRRILHNRLKDEDVKDALKEYQKTGKGPKGTIFIDGIPHIRRSLVDFNKNDATLENVLYNLKLRYEDNKVRVLLSEGNRNLSEFQAGKEGTYSFYLKPTQGDDGKKIGAGSGCVKLYRRDFFHKGNKTITEKKLVIEALKGEGRLSWMTRNSGIFTTFDDFQKGYVPDYLHEGTKIVVGRLQKTLKFALETYKFAEILE